MRLLYALALAALVAGCASLPPADVDQESSVTVNARLSARADSLLAVSPDSLSVQEASWLDAYQSRRYAEATAEDRRRERRTQMSIGVALTAVALLALYGIKL